MGTYYNRGRVRPQNGFYGGKVAWAARVQGVAGTTLAVFASFALLTVTNAIITIITVIHEGHSRRYMYITVLLPFLIAASRFIFVLPFASLQTILAPKLSGSRIIFMDMIYACHGDRLMKGWGTHSTKDRSHTSKKTPSLFGLRAPRIVDANFSLIQSKNGYPISEHFFEPLKLVWLAKNRAVFKTTLHGGYYHHLPTKMMIMAAHPQNNENPLHQVRIVIPMIGIIDGDLLQNLVLVLNRPGPLTIITSHLAKIQPGASYYVHIDNDNDSRRIVAVRIPSEPWISSKHALAMLEVPTYSTQSVKESPPAADKVGPENNMWVRLWLPSQPRFPGIPQSKQSSTSSGSTRSVDHAFDATENEGENTVTNKYAILYRQQSSRPRGLGSAGLKYLQPGELIVREMPGSVPRQLRQGGMTRKTLAEFDPLEYSNTEESGNWLTELPMPSGNNSGTVSLWICPDTVHRTSRNMIKNWIFEEDVQGRSRVLPWGGGKLYVIDQVEQPNFLKQTWTRVRKATSSSV